MQPTSEPGKAVVAGGTGLVGRALVHELLARGFEVSVLTRGSSAPPGARPVWWDARTVAEWRAEFEGARLVANLCGASLARRWTAVNQRTILDSRVQPTEAFGRAIGACRNPPVHWINASAVGYYGDSGFREVSEAGRPGAGFLAETAQAWEAACLGVETPSTTKTVLRLGPVLSREAGLLPELLSLARKFLGGAAGSGNQYVSWIHIDDLVGMALWVVEGGYEGVFNATAPNPVPNRVLMAELRRMAGRPWSPPVPVAAIKLGAWLKGVAPSLILEGVRAVPQQALARGFSFRFPALRAALEDLV